MFRPLTKALLLFILINVTAACSYSPNKLKEIYNELPTELASDIKESVDLTPAQSRMVDDYAEQLGQWHRHNKLPQYSHYFAKLAQLAKQETPALPPLQQILAQMGEMPHFEQAKHLSPKMAAVGRSLNNDQISQLEKSLNNEYKEELAEINNNSLATSLKKDLIMMLRLIDIKLSTKQLKVLNTEVKHYHDIRHAELTAERKLDQQLISVLKSHDDPQFVPRFVSIWNNSTPRLSATNTQKQQQNRQTDAVLMQKLIMSFDTKQKQNLADKLLSISQTFSELANESN